MNIDVLCTGIDCPIKGTCRRFNGKSGANYPHFAEIPGNWDRSTVDPDGNPIAIFRCDMHWGEYEDSILEQLKNIMR